MAGSVNRVILVGNLGRDPEVRSTRDGAKIVTIALATSDGWKDKDGQWHDATQWHQVVIFNERLAEVAEKYAHKGSKLFVEGSLQTRKWTDQQGVDQYRTEVVLQKYKGDIQLLDARGDGQRTPQQSRGREYAGQGSDLDEAPPF